MKVNGKDYPIYPPTPAFAKAGAAPGTTAGVELVFLSNRHPKATSMAFYGRPSLPFSSPKTLQTATTPPSPLPWLRWKAKATPRPDPLLFLGGPACRSPGIRSQRASEGHFHGFFWASSGFQACRLPSLKPSKPLKPLKGHFNGFLWASSARKSPHPWLFMGVQACQTPKRPLPWLLMGFQRRQKPTSMAFYGRPSLPFARPKTLQTLQTLQTPKTPKRPLQWLLIGFQRPHPWLFMGVQACRLPGLKPSKPQTPKTPKRPLQWLLMGFQRRQKPTSITFYGRPSLPFARPRTLHMGFQRRQKPTSITFYGRPSLPFARPRTLQTPKKPLQCLLMGFQRRQKPTSMAFYGRPSLPFARPKTLQTLQTPKTPKRPLQWLLIGFQRPHPWLFMGVQACRLPGLKRSKPSKPLKPLKGHFHGFL